MAIRDILIKDNPWFVKRINAWMMRKKHREMPEGYFRISGISQCARMMAYNYLGVAKYPTNDIFSLRRMERGTWHHGIWFDIFRHAGIPARAGELLTCDDPPLRGTPDWIITDEEGIDWLIEWKSTTNYNSAISWEYYTQWSLYSYLLDIPRGYLVMEHPSTWDLNPTRMELDVEYVNDLLLWIHTIISCTEREMIPDNNVCPYGKTCDLHEFCHSEKGNLR